MRFRLLVAGALFELEAEPAVTCESDVSELFASDSTILKYRRLNLAFPIEMTFRTDLRLLVRIYSVASVDMVDDGADVDLAMLQENRSGFHSWTASSFFTVPSP